MTFVVAKVRRDLLRSKKLSTSSWHFFDEFPLMPFRVGNSEYLNNFKTRKIYRRIKA